MTNLIKVYDPIKGWVKPSERTTVYRSPVIDPLPYAPRDRDLIPCPVCKTGNLIIKSQPCGICIALRRKMVAA